MSETITLPELGESVTEGTVTRWLKEVGDTIEVDEPIVEISTDKVDTEIPSPVAGTLLEILVQEDEDIEVGEALAVVGDADESASDQPADDSADEEAPAEEDTAEEEPAEDTSEQDEPAQQETAEEEPAKEAPAASGDAEEVKLPELGESVTEGTITRWLKEVGDEVEVDEPIVEISTDKVDTEIPSPVAGTLLEIKVQEDEDIEVGEVLALIGSSDSAPSESEPAQDSEPQEEKAQDDAPQEEASQQQDSESTSASEPEPEPESTPEPTPAPKPESKPAAEESPSSPDETPRGDGYVTPLVRRLAREQGVDLAEVTGTGVGGRIRKQDVLAAAAAKEYETRDEQQSQAAAPAATAQTAARPAPKDPSSSIDPSKRGTTEKASRIRQVIADRMVESLDTSAQLTQVHEIDMTRIVQLRNQVKERFKAENGVNLTFLAFITQAATEALRAHPALNAQYDAESKEITYHDSEDIGIAVDTERGLLVPVIKGAGNLNLTGIANAISDLALRTRDNQVKPDELSGGTFSITNLGSFGALFDTPVINQPQVAILGPGNIVKRPMVITDAEGNDVIAIRHMMYLSLTYDHRIVDGADAGRFMTQLKNRLEAGEFGGQLGL
ncbi:2-oxoglutarate dehydrogenase, E2 component, dihydrolipoamide succinyltransferase [Enteractinococcus fodinae]|uniref:Dihydrolipoamide acetyltransferase component of pyruvate dehydrogenase complex n=1 Tax=Enteractinococcus fodinae TaxID=684663 RepID=A0ABU2B4F2_9MICC|nr:2-oxoglutarate dehydrogenase, E2 component, dihydrolipoamide succinyltransferase [Enteractinococcus fodinae]MDR7347289.1 2-oxoglutarate dehydrogenase E2 component (dihydrolipoamide succinyltransferase) [Enteractinococcus fodinae]